MQLSLYVRTICARIICVLPVCAFLLFGHLFGSAEGKPVAQADQGEPNNPTTLFAQLGCLLGCDENGTMPDIGRDLSSLSSQLDISGIDVLKDIQNISSSLIGDSPLFAFPDPNFNPIVVLLGEDDEGSPAHVVLGQEQGVTKTKDGDFISTILKAIYNETEPLGEIAEKEVKEEMRSGDIVDESPRSIGGRMDVNILTKQNMDVDEEEEIISKESSSTKQDNTNEGESVTEDEGMPLRDMGVSNEEDFESELEAEEESNLKSNSAETELTNEAETKSEVVTEHGSEIEEEPIAEPEVTTGPYEEHEAEPKEDDEAKPGLKSQINVAAESGAVNNLKAVPESEVGENVEAEYEPESKVEAEPEADVEAEAEPEPEAEPETDLESENIYLEDSDKKISENKVEPKIKLKLDTNIKQELEPESESEPEPEAESNIESEEKGTDISEDEYESDIKVEVDTKIEPESEQETKTEDSLESEVFDLKDEYEVLTEPEPETSISETIVPQDNTNKNQEEKKESRPIDEESQITVKITENATNHADDSTEALNGAKPSYVDSTQFRRRPKKSREFNPPTGFDVQEGRRARRV